MATLIRYTIFTFDRHCEQSNCQDKAIIATATVKATTTTSAAENNNHNKENGTKRNEAANERHIRKMVRITHKRRMIK